MDGWMIFYALGAKLRSSGHLSWELVSQIFSPAEFLLLSATRHNYPIKEVNWNLTFYDPMGSRILSCTSTALQHAIWSLLAGLFFLQMHLERPNQAFACGVGDTSIRKLGLVPNRGLEASQTSLSWSDNILRYWRMDTAKRERRYLPNKGNLPNKGTVEVFKAPRIRRTAGVPAQNHSIKSFAQRFTNIYFRENLTARHCALLWRASVGSAFQVTPLEFPQVTPYEVPPLECPRYISRKITSDELPARCRHIPPSFSGIHCRRPVVHHPAQLLLPSSPYGDTIVPQPAYPLCPYSCCFLNSGSCFLIFFDAPPNVVSEPLPVPVFNILHRGSVAMARGLTTHSGHRIFPSKSLEPRTNIASRPFRVKRRRPDIAQEDPARPIKKKKLSKDSDTPSLAPTTRIDIPVIYPGNYCKDKRDLVHKDGPEAPGCAQLTKLPPGISALFPSLSTLLSNSTVLSRSPVWNKFLDRIGFKVFAFSRSSNRFDNGHLGCGYNEYGRLFNGDLPEKVDIVVAANPESSQPPRHRKPAVNLKPTAREKKSAKKIVEKPKNSKSPKRAGIYLPTYQEVDAKEGRSENPCATWIRY
ncbi:hypothetical protein B0H11DRAFT_1936021 [Mycena galericulata]|nr:hypothetical protein B0H11DRAFT_1936021 [Mycena galericulata]